MTSPLSFPNIEFNLANPPATAHVHISQTRPLQHEPSRSALSTACDCRQHRAVRPVESFCFEFGLQSWPRD